MKFKMLLEAESIVKLLTRKAKELGLASSSSRYGEHLRMKCPGGNFEEVLSKVLPVMFKTEISDVQFSKTYKTFMVTLLEPFEGFPEGTSFPFVPTSRKLVSPNTLISDKQLTPDNILGKDLGKLFTRQDLFDYCFNLFSHKNEIFPDTDYRFVSYTMLGMLQTAMGVDNGKIDSASKVDPTDMTRILKDFGEIVCAIKAFEYFPEAEYVQFPTKSNEAMVDFMVLNKDEKIIANVSVKSGTKGQVGAAPSMKNIRQFLERFENTKFGELFKIFTDDRPVVQKILDACEILDKKALRIFKDLTGIKKLTVENISDYCRENLYSLKDNLKDFYDYIKRTFKDESISKSTTKKLKTYSGFVLSPLGYHIMDLLNKDRGFLDFMSDVIRSLDVIQMNITYKDKLEFSTKEIKNADFWFDFHNNVFLPGNNNFGFKMRKENEYQVEPILPGQ